MPAYLDDFQDFKLHSVGILCWYWLTSTNSNCAGTVVCNECLALGHTTDSLPRVLYLGALGQTILALGTVKKEGYKMVFPVAC